MMKNCKEGCCKFCVKWMNRNLGLLLLRVAIGVIFVAHGWQKFQIMPEWTAFITGATQAGGLELPMFLAYLVPTIEVVAGAAMILGLGTCVAGILLSFIMIGALYIKIKAGGTLIPGPASPMVYELDLILLAAALGVSFSGPGKYSLASKIKKNCGDVECDNCKVK